MEGGGYGIGSHFLVQCPECRLLNAVSTTVPLVVVLEILVVLLVLVVLMLLTLLKLLTILVLLLTTIAASTSSPRCTRSTNSTGWPKFVIHRSLLDMDNYPRCALGLGESLGTSPPGTAMGNASGSGGAWGKTTSTTSTTRTY